MKNIKIFKLSILFFLYGSILFGQNNFEYRCALKNVKSGWQSILLEPEMYDLDVYNSILGKKCRILDSENQDVPYVLEYNRSSETSQTIENYLMINVGENGKQYFYTFENKTPEIVNQMLLSIDEKEYELSVTVQGSEDQKSWITILKNFRLVGFDNQYDNFRATSVHFGNSKFRYLRLLVSSKKKPNITGASFYLIDDGKKNEKWLDASSLQIDYQEDKKEKKSYIILDANKKFPIEELSFDISDTLAYSRKIRIEVEDDTHKKNGQPIWTLAQSGFIRSFENTNGHFSFHLQTSEEYLNSVQKMRITVENNDNSPLRLSNFQAKYHPLEIVARFPEDGNYMFYYGGKNEKSAVYDVEDFRDKIPKNLATVSLGNAEKLIVSTPKIEEKSNSRKYLLWAVMLVIMLILGWQTAKMMKGKGN